MMIKPSTQNSKPYAAYPKPQTQAMNLSGKYKMPNPKSLNRKF